MLNRLEDYHENDIAEVMSELTLQERKKFFRICHAEMLAEIFEYLDEDDAGKYLDEMDVKKAADVISELEADTAVKVLHELPKEKRELVLEAIDPEVRKQIRLINSFDEDEIGSRMSTNFVVIRENLTIKQAMNELVRQAEENDNITTLIMAFQSLILDMAGNVGTQSLAVTIRVLMDENLTIKQKWRLVGKEMRVGFSNGLLLGVISFFFVGLYIHFAKQKTMAFSFAVSGCIGASLLLNVMHLA